MIKICKKILKILLILFLAGLILIFGISFYVTQSTKKQIITPEAAASIKDADCILILGAGIRADNTPTPMLEDRLNTGISLYQEAAAPKLIMSGDHGHEYYDEVQVMKDYAMDKDVPSSDIFMDHAGFSTYDSIYRARDIFQAKKIIIVTQSYHLYRALHLADKLGLDAVGVSADTIRYGGQTYRELREILARDKDFVTGIFKPEPTFLGDAIPVSGDGNATND